jgi:salicylate hydroxylase
MSRKLKVGIVGGGIGGVATAVALRQHGIEAHLFERVAQFGEVGAGIQMTPNAVKVIREFGLWGELAKVSFLPECILGKNWDSGDVTFEIPLKADCPRLYGAEFFHVHRADLHQLLAERVDMNKVAFGASCVDVTQTDKGAVAHFADGSSFEADLIIGADGVRSTVRTALFGQDDPLFTGHMTYRAVVPTGGVVDYVAPAATFWMGPNAHVVTYYCKSGTAVNIVAVHETKEWIEESWSSLTTREIMMNDFIGWHPNLIKLFEQVTEVYRWGLFDRDPMPLWSKGRATLLGDACHPMLPFLSQGAAMAIEDSYVLAKALGALPGHVEDALRLYEEERRPRTARVQLEARERGRTYHLPTKEEQAKRDAEYRELQKKDPHAGGIKTNWVYAYNATDFEP